MQLCLRNVIIEENNTDFSKGLTDLVTRLEELALQFHQDFQTDRHKIRFLSDTVAEYSELSLGPIENITSQQFTFSRFVTALYDSIQAKEKVKMIRNESNAQPGRDTHSSPYTSVNTIATHAIFAVT